MPNSQHMWQQTRSLRGLALQKQSAPYTSNTPLSLSGVSFHQDVVLLAQLRPLLFPHILSQLFGVQVQLTSAPLSLVLLTFQGLRYLHLQFPVLGLFLMSALAQIRSDIH